MWIFRIYRFYKYWNVDNSREYSDYLTNWVDTLILPGFEKVISYEKNMPKKSSVKAIGWYEKSCFQPTHFPMMIAFKIPSNLTEFFSHIKLCHYGTNCIIQLFISYG